MMLPQFQPAPDHHLDHALLEKLRRLMAPEAFVELLESFLARTRIHLSNAERCLVDSDLEKLKFTIHTLKGSSANVGVAGLSQLCSELEKQLKQGNDIESVSPRLKAICTEFEVSQQLLSELMLTLQQKTG
jgi:HPt (histidine-containing phosphotransfer) domain-containing protein